MWGRAEHPSHSMALFIYLLFVISLFPIRGGMCWCYLKILSCTIRGGVAYLTFDHTITMYPSCCGPQITQITFTVNKKLERSPRCLSCRVQSKALEVGCMLVGAMWLCARSIQKPPFGLWFDVKYY